MCVCVSDSQGLGCDWKRLQRHPEETWPPSYDGGGGSEATAHGRKCAARRRRRAGGDSLKPSSSDLWKPSGLYNHIFSWLLNIFVFILVYLIRAENKVKKRQRVKCWSSLLTETHQSCLLSSLNIRECWDTQIWKQPLKLNFCWRKIFHLLQKQWRVNWRVRTGWHVGEI